MRGNTSIYQERTKIEVCPVCNTLNLIPGEDVGVGPGYIQCSPDHCECCGYIEAGKDPTDKTFEYYVDCWEKGIISNPDQEMIQGPISKIYSDYIDNLGEVRLGSCREHCINMVDAFPELRLIYGKYWDALWGYRHHFWCLDPSNIIVDPTVSQYPTKGSGDYTFDRFYPVELARKI